MSIKTIIFDLDGVLVDAKKIHFDSLNKSLSLEGDDFVLSWCEHLTTYDGLKTNQKLELLHLNKNLPKESFKRVWERKQDFTYESLSKIRKNYLLIECLSHLKNCGYKLVCCSNSIKKTIDVVLSNLGIISFFDLVLSNQDVTHSKPHPEIFWKAMTILGVVPEETLILEDSPVGLLSADRSKCNVLRIETPQQINKEKILHEINTINKMKDKKPKWKDKKLNIVIPMAGAGSRFEKLGYTFPKPLVDVKGEPMIKLVVDNLNIDANFIYVVRAEHREKYNLDTLLNLITPNCKIISVDKITEGAACTTLLTKNYVDNENPLMIVNSDQFLEWDSNDFMYRMNETPCDAGIITFTSTHPKWSFVKVDKSGFVSEVAEKKPISDIATAGVYYWKRGADYIFFTERMIEENVRVNGEFYVCPVFNLAITAGLKVKRYHIDRMWGLGTPEDLDFFCKSIEK